MKLSECSAEFQDRLQALLDMVREERPEVQQGFIAAYATEDYSALKDVAHWARQAAFTEAVLEFARYF